MQSQTQIITPAIAAAYLELNVNNRPLRKRSVLAFSGAMTRGEWMLTPQGIAISSEGRLIDGQHRLMAVVMSKQTIPMTVWHNVPNDVFSVYDRGTPRTMSDTTNLPRKHVELLNFFHHEKIGLAEKPTAAQAMEINRVFGNDISALLEYSPRTAKVFSSVGVRAAAVLLSKEGQRKRAFDLYLRLVHNDFAGLPPIVSAMVKSALNERLTAASGSGAQVEIFCKALFALDAKNSERVLMPRFLGALRGACAARANKWLK